MFDGFRRFVLNLARRAIKIIDREFRLNGKGLKIEENTVAAIKKDDEDSGILHYKLCQVLWGILDLQMTIDHESVEQLRPFCVAQQCGANAHAGEQTIFWGKLALPFCSNHKPIAVKHVKSFPGLETRNIRPVYN